MIYISVPIVDGALQIPYEKMREGIGITETQAYCAMDDDTPMQDNWEVITQAEFESKRPVYEPTE